MFRDLTSLGSPSVLALVTIAAVGYLWIDRKCGAALFVVIAVAGGAALEILLKLEFARLAVATFLALLVGFTRVYLGVHWPTDLLAGWCVGAAWALGCWLIATWLQHRGAIEGEESHEFRA